MTDSSELDLVNLEDLQKVIQATRILDYDANGGAEDDCGDDGDSDGNMGARPRRAVSDRARRAGYNLLDNTNASSRRIQYKSLLEEVKEFSQVNEESTEISDDLQIFQSKQTRLFGIGCPPDMFVMDTEIIKSQMQLVNKRFLKTLGSADDFSVSRYAFQLRLLCLKYGDGGCEDENSDEGASLLSVHQIGSLSRLSRLGLDREQLAFTSLPPPYTCHKISAPDTLPLFYQLSLADLDVEVGRKEKKQRISRGNVAPKSRAGAIKAGRSLADDDDHKNKMWMTILQLSDNGDHPLSFLECATDLFFMSNLARNILTLSSLVQECLISYHLPPGKVFSDLVDGDVALATKVLINLDTSEEGKTRFKEQHPVHQGHINVNREMWMDYYYTTYQHHLLPPLSSCPPPGSTTDWGELQEEYTLISEPMRTQLIRELILPKRKTINII